MHSTEQKRSLHAAVESATMEQAQAWAATTDKFIHCLVLLGLSMQRDGAGFCTQWIERLEDRFQEILDLTLSVPVVGSAPEQIPPLPRLVNADTAAFSTDANESATPEGDSDDGGDEDEDEGRYLNYYCHEDCPVQPGVEWDDHWSCMCNDHCPACDAEIEPYQSDDTRTGETIDHVAID